MSNPRKLYPALFVSGALVLVGCGKSGAPAAAAHGEAKEEGAANAASFKAGRGLQLAPETAKALGLTTAEAEERALARLLRLDAQVFRAGPPALASAMVPTADAEALAGKQITGAKLVRIGRELEKTTRQAELVFELSEGGSAVGDFVSLTLKAPAGNVLSVPHSALLSGATGTFVYVVNSGAYLRTAVKIGATDEAHVEITDGLYAGDVVVTAPVEALYLTELRLTKGGGHSH